MSWTFAPYIPVVDIADKPVGYVWQNGNPLFYYKEDSRLENRFGKTTIRGVVALSAAFAEWVAARWPSRAEPALVWEIQAAWAGIVDWRYWRPPLSTPHMPKTESCQGPQAGPICDAFIALGNIVFRAQRSTLPTSHCAGISQCVQHVLPDDTVFKEWRRAAVERLSELYPRQKDAALGVPIPREALDPQYPYSPESADELLRKFLRGLDPSQNPFLRTPEEMQQLGFEGTPYDIR